MTGFSLKQLGAVSCQIFVNIIDRGGIRNRYSYQYYLYWRYVHVVVSAHYKVNSTIALDKMFFIKKKNGTIMHIYSRNHLLR